MRERGNTGWKTERSLTRPVSTTATFFKRKHFSEKSSLLLLVRAKWFIHTFIIKSFLLRAEWFSPPPVSERSRKTLIWFISQWKGQIWTFFYICWREDLFASLQNVKTFCSSSFQENFRTVCSWCSLSLLLLSQLKHIVFLSGGRMKR